MPKQVFTQTITCKLSVEDHKRLEEHFRLSKFKTKAEMLRHIIRDYLDFQEDQIGSKRHFTKSMRSELLEFRASIEYLLVLVITAGYYNHNHALTQFGQQPISLAEYMDVITGQLDNKANLLFEFFSTQSKTHMTTITKERRDGK